MRDRRWRRWRDCEYAGGERGGVVRWWGGRGGGEGREGGEGDGE